MVDYLIVGAALALAVFILARQMLRIASGGGCGCEGGGQGRVLFRKRRARRKSSSHLPYTLELQVSGMHCEHCAQAVEDALEALDGIGAEAELPGTVRMRSARPIDAAACAEAIRAAGYGVEDQAAS